MRTESFCYVTLQHGNLTGLPSNSVSYTSVPEECIPKMIIQGMKCVEKKNQLDATEWFIARITCSICFGHFYAHHQEFETICVLLPPMMCSDLLAVSGGQMQGSRLCVQNEGCCTTRVVQHPSSRTHSLLPCT